MYITLKYIKYKIYKIYNIYKIYTIYNNIQQQKLMFCATKHPEGPNHPAENELQYVVVDFPDCTIPDEEKLIPGKRRTWVPIPVCHPKM